MLVARTAAVAVLFALALAAFADEAQDAFNQVYGDDLKRVVATASTADDIALAKQILDAAKKAEKQPEFLSLLCEKAYDLAAKDASGLATAAAAMDLLAEKVPEKKVEALQKTAALCQKQYAAARGDTRAKAGESLIQALSTLANAQAAAGDFDAATTTLRQALAVATAIKSESKPAIQTQLEGLALGEKMEKRIEALKAKLAAKPDDATSRKELVRLLLVEEDNPAEAAKFVDESLDEAMRKYVPAAAKPMEEAPELACKELGEWYRGLADQAAVPASKGAMLRQAQGYYTRFLELHTAEDLARTTAALTLKKIEDAIVKLGAAANKPGAPGPWIDLLKLVDLEKNVVNGTWQRQGAALGPTAPALGVRVMVPLPISGSYELQARVVRLSGNGQATFILPLKSAQFEAVFGHANGKAFLYIIKDRDVSVPSRIENGREFEAQVKVLQEEDKVTISMAMDGKPLLAWQGPESQVSLAGGWKLPQKNCLGLGVYNSVAVFKSVRLRMLSGEAKTVEAPASAAPTKLPAAEAPKKEAPKTAAPKTELPKDVKADELQNITKALDSVKARAKPPQLRKVLVLSLTKGFRHGHIPLSAQAFEMLGRKTGAFEAVLTDDVSYFAPDKLKGFDAVLFNSNTGEIFEGRDDLKAALLDFVKGGKGMVGVHAVADCCTKWKEFGDMMGGCFNSHPKQDGKILLKMAVKLDEPKHPLLKAFKGQDFEITEEIFQFREPYARAKLRVLLSVDGAKMTLDPGATKQKDGDYPVSWIRACAKGRVFYCALAHERSTFWNPTVLQYYLDGIQFAIGDLKFDAADTAPGAK
ncbi:MAG: ThuA domain-containing protein [Planctomycetes bacterium]|nr:ThuA domain-containing protein [Planctomycetota bacterium]